jgi:hypothetical protein
MFIHMYGYVCMCIYVCLYVCVYVCIIYVFMFVYTYISPLNVLSFMCKRRVIFCSISGPEKLVKIYILDTGQIPFAT